MAKPPPTIYFGYGSNLWLHQMCTRCPTSTYLGVARLSNYTWIINDRGYANIVEANKAPSNNKNNKSSPETSPPSPYSTLVFGLVYALTAADEARLDKNEGVPVAYTKETLTCDFWASSAGEKVDTGRRRDEAREMLVYIDRNRTAPDEPREEYVYRMNKGIADAVEMGVPEGYVEDVMRKYIPAGKGEGTKEVEEFAATQAAEFRDESGVFE